MNQPVELITPTPVEAIGGETVEAPTPSNGVVEGTPAPDATVHQETPEGETPAPESTDDTPVYSKRSLEAERAAALEEGRNTANRERDEAHTERRNRLTQLVSESDAAPAPVVKAVRNALNRIVTDLSDEDAEPILKSVRDARAVIEEAAFSIVGQDYRAAIDAVIGNDPAAVKAFWDKAIGLDPALDAAHVFPLLIEEKALATRAVREADPEALLKSNPKLKAHVEKYADEKYQAGVAQGLISPKPEAPVEGSPTASSRSLTIEEAKTLPVVDLIKRRAALASSRS